MLDDLIIYDEAGNTLKRESVMEIGGLAADDEILYAFSPGKVHRWSLNACEEISSLYIGVRFFHQILLSEGDEQNQETPREDLIRAIAALRNG